MSTDGTARVVLRCLHGLEELVAAECAERGWPTNGAIRHREVHLIAPADPQILRLRTADDAFLHAIDLTDIGHTKAELSRIRAQTATIDAQALLDLRRRCGGAYSVHAIDVSASFVGRRNFNRYDIEDAVGAVLAEQLGVSFHSRRTGTPPPEGSASWRVTLNGQSGTVALRIADRPLHRRDYKNASVSGTLHPPLAAAMVRLAEIPAGANLLDPCCGVATLPVEAYDLHNGVEAARSANPSTDAAGPAYPSYDVICCDESTSSRRLSGNHSGSGAPPGAVQVWGADLDADTLTGARTNAGPRAINWLRADAAALPLADGSFDRVAVNPPWGRQVRPGGGLEGEPERFWGELRRVLAASGRAVVLAHDPDEQRAAAERAGLRVTAAHPVSLFGTHPQLLVLV